jgi:hypothetical protein
MKFLAILLALPAVFLAVMNSASLLAAALSRRSTSTVPFVGAFFGFLAVAAWPQNPTWAWLLPALDPGTITGALGLPHLARTLFQFSRFNLHAVYTGPQHSLRLYRHGEFLLRYEPPQGLSVTEPIQVGGGGNWSRSGAVLTLLHGSHRIDFLVDDDRRLHGPPGEAPLALTNVTLERREA